MIWKGSSKIRKALFASALVMVAGVFGPHGLTQNDIVLVSGTISSDRTFTTGTIYVLQGTVFVENATLTIQPGVLIAGETASNGTLVITRTGRINAVGTPDSPIVFTSDQPLGFRDRGDWGGIIINGNAPLNIPGGEGIGEGDTGRYGGNNPDDSSGTLKYVRVEYAGTEFSPDNELNGIAFQGVGRGTEVEFVQVHYSQDDGMEFFGGTVDVKYAVCSGIADDSFDWTDGWTGRGQFWIAQQHGDDADQGIEADNNAENNDLTPRSNPSLFNLTLIGAPTFDVGDESDKGILVREGTAATIGNSIVTGFKEEGLEIDDPATFRTAERGELTIQSTIFFRNNPNFSDDSSEDPTPPFTTEEFAMMSQDVVVVDPGLRDPFDIFKPDFRPAPGTPAIDGTVPFVLPPNDGFFDPAAFIGAVGQEPSPNPDDPYLGNWLADWTNFDPR